MMMIMLRFWERKIELALVHVCMYYSNDYPLVNIQQSERVLLAIDLQRRGERTLCVLKEDFVDELTRQEKKVYDATIDSGM